MTDSVQLNDSFELLTATVLRVKAERDALLAAVQAYFNAGSERSEYQARERMRDAVEKATGERP